MTTAPLSSLGEDQRAELAAIAARAQHANQPRNLVLLAGVIAAVAALVLSMAWRSYAAARDARDAAHERATAAAAKAAELKALERAGANTTSQLNEPISRFRSRIERAGVEAGLRDPLRLPPDRPPVVERRLGTRQMQLVYEVRDPSFDALVRFMQRAVEEVPGLEVHSVTIRPEAQVWFLQVMFSRWEKLEGV